MRAGALLLLAAYVGFLAVMRQFRVDQRETYKSDTPRSEREHKKPEFTEGRPWREGERAFMSEGDLFQIEGCPYVLSRPQAQALARNVHASGNEIALVAHAHGRTGNHFMTLSSYLAMGYCCRSRVLVLPKNDHVLPSENGNFLPQQRFFGFSDVSLPWSEYQHMRDDPEICRPRRKDSGREAFGFEDVHWKLLDCMNRVYLRGCEKAYLGEMVDTEAFCPKSEPGKRKGAGSLVLHIRSGDIFDPWDEGKKRPGFGQPPLQYYMRVLAAREWEKVTVLTASGPGMPLNPVYNVLDVMADSGNLGGNVRLFHNRTLLEDVKEMLCADALAASKTSLNFLTSAHSRANVFFFPTPCGKGLYKRMKDPPVKASFQNTTLLLLEKPGAEVFGIEWRGNGSDYSVYKEWHDNPQQLLEMTAYKGIGSLRKCAV
ncbi:unnamed protein product [Pylaiella littoralis]